MSAVQAARWSGYFRRTTDSWERRAPQLRSLLDESLAAPVTAGVVAKWLTHLTRADEGLSGSQTLARGLRQLRQLVIVALMERDARGAADLDEVCLAMSAFADLAVQAAVNACDAELAERHGAPLDAAGRPQPMLVVGMGKLGAHELNVSSDIDLVYVARDQGMTVGNSEGRNAIAATDYFTRLAQRTTQLLAETTEDGFVFRVDTRLRPDGDAGPLVCTLPMLERYFYSQGREWERFAWLKARVIAASPSNAPGDGAPTGALDRAREDTDALHQIVHPFVFRRYLDFGAFDALRDLHGRIRAEARKREARRGGAIDVKLGRGGIRETEFIAQLFQIVRGGRDAGLRELATLPTLAAIAERGLLPPEDCTMLADAYVWLRRIEHALQYRDDAQTHTLPEDDTVRAEVAGLLGVAPQALIERLDTVRANVEGCFDALLAKPVDEEAAPSVQIDLGAASAEAVGSPIEAAADPVGETDDAAPIRLNSPVAHRFDALRAAARWRNARTETQSTVERLLARAARLSADWPADDRERALLRVIDLFDRVIGRPGYLSLLDRYPDAFEHLLHLLGRAKWAADYLMNHPVVLDELLDGQILTPTDWRAWAADVQRQLDQLGDGVSFDIERQMDLLREAHHAQVFRLLAQDLNGRLSVETLSDHLSELADRVLDISITTLWPQIRGRHREQPAFAVIAYGRLGGKELGYASDLDLVYIYDDADPTAPEVYARLAQRLSGWLSTTTAAGMLFDIDVRLRPNGNAGLLVTSLAAFEHYQRTSAWVWEHQALTRARFAAGDAALGGRFEAVRRAVLALPREAGTLADEVVAMRQRMHAGHLNPGSDFDLKHDAGGMVDVEFAMQYLVLAYAARHPELLDNVGNIALLGRAGQAGLIDRDLAARCADAYRRYRRMQHALRLNDARFVRVHPDEVAAERDVVRRLWQVLFGAR